MEKTFRSTQKFLIMSPRKVRLVAAMARKMKPVEAVEKLPFVGKKASEVLVKVIKSALANAKVLGVGETDLTFKEIQIGEGPRLKRGRAASRGRWHQYKHRMSHIRVVLSSTKSEIKEVKSETEKVEAPQVETKVEKKGTKKNGTKS